MGAYKLSWMAFILCTIALTPASAFNCDAIKQKYANNQPINKPVNAEICLYSCYMETYSRSKQTTPDQCFNDYVQPYITKVLKKQIPTSDQIQDCLNAKDRSNCKATLLYHFTKWYEKHYSTDFYKRYAKFIYSIWALNPDLNAPIGSPFWDFETASDLAKINLDDDVGIQAAVKMTSPSDATKFPDIPNEIRRQCYKPASDYNSMQFCGIRILMNIASKVRTLAKGKQKYTARFQKYIGAIKANYVAFSIMFDRNRADNVAPSTEKAKASLLDEQFNEIADLTRAGNVEDIKTFIQFMPEPYLLEKGCKATIFPTVKRRCCILEKVVEQLLMYTDIIEKRMSSSQRKAVTINFSLNLRAVITELRGEEVFKMILDSRYQNSLDQQETASLIEGKFGQLQNYFSKLQSFNMQKANADVGYVKGRIKYYEGKTQTAIDDVSNQVGGILKAALITQGLEVAEKVIKLTLAIVEACNPFKAVFNGGTATDIMDATAELMKAISGLVEAIALKSAWTDIIATVKTISAGFQKNSEFLSSVGRIVAKVKLNDFPDDDEFEQCKSTFLRLYNDYSPKVDKQMLEVLATKIELSVTSGCELINAATGSAANGYVAYVKSNLFCQKAAASITSLKTIFEEIYDFQFEFIENMASYLRSATGYHASKQMVTLSGKPMAEDSDANERKSELKANIILAHTTYEMQKQGVIQSLCDFLEYKGGETPTICKESLIDVPTLLSYIPRRCQMISVYGSIPFSSSADPPSGYINIKNLYSGQEVSFDIPNHDWLKQNKWVSQDDDFKAIYIRSFVIYLPTIGKNKKIRVKVRSMGGNKFKTGGTKYSLIPSDTFSTVYTAGKDYYPCSGKEIENPYNICEDQKLPKLCVQSHALAFNDATMLYPTPFARFKIKAKGLTATQAPDPATTLDIKAKIDMCVFEGDSTGKKRSLTPKHGCCKGNTYWNEARSACSSCTGSSTSNLNGYYCENNRHALLQRKKKTAS